MAVGRRVGVTEVEAGPPAVGGSDASAGHRLSVLAASVKSEGRLALALGAQDLALLPAGSEAACGVYPGAEAEGWASYLVRGGADLA